MGHLNAGSGNLQWQMGLGGVNMGGQGGMPYAPLAGQLGEVSLGMPGNVAYLQQYGAGMGALGMGGQGGGWHRGGGAPGMAWPYRGGGGGGGDAGSAAAAQNAQNLNYQQMLMNASLYQQSQGAAGGGGGGGLVDVNLLPGGAGGYVGGGSMRHPAPPTCPTWAGSTRTAAGGLGLMVGARHGSQRRRSMRVRRRAAAAAARLAAPAAAVPAVPRAFSSSSDARMGARLWWAGFGSVWWRVYG